MFWFWSNWRQIAHFTASAGPGALIMTWLMLFAVATLTLAMLEAARNEVLRVHWDGEPLVHSRYLRTALSTAVVAITAGVIVLLDSPAPDIVYKSF